MEVVNHHDENNVTKLENDNPENSSSESHRVSATEALPDFLELQFIIAKLLSPDRQTAWNPEMRTFLFLPVFFIIPLSGGVFGNSWSLQVSRDVSGEMGKAASLPCSFSPPHKSHPGGLTVIWRVRQPYNGTVVFRCSSDHNNEPCKTTVNYMNKFRLIGNPRNNNISISIGNLTWEDSNRYYCRVELSSDRHDKYETKSGTWLHVSAPPRIVNISVGFDHRRGYHAVCIAEGEPAPSLLWIDPQNHHQDKLPSSSTLKHQMSTELHYLHQDGKYTCVATNRHGRTEGSVFFFKFRPQPNNSSPYVTLWAALGAKLLMLLLMFAAASYYSKDTTKSKADSFQRAQDSTYENYTQRTP